MKLVGLQFALLLFLVGFNVHGGVPKDYKGKPFQDSTHSSGPQSIPGRVQAALYDLGGEGIAYHDVDPINHGSGELNYKPEHCEAGVPAYICHFRENEGVDISYVKKHLDLNHANGVAPEWQQLYIGWTEDGEWTNYTVEVKKAGTYRIVAMYSNLGQTIQFSLNQKPAADCRLPVDTPKQFPVPNAPDWLVWHIWNKADCGEITFPQAGLQLLTLHYRRGNNLAYFDFVPAGEKPADGGLAKVAPASRGGDTAGGPAAITFVNPRSIQ
jgi:hypothetical protein